MLLWGRILENETF
uniref:Uncharacterized protein n=1 Tax=Anguilla anguilla TaxID=7936 RepID=A0A0E9V6P4_ANGAN